MEIIKVARIPPVLAKPEMTVHEAVQLMADKQVGAVVVTNPDGEVTGIFTERDYLLRIGLHCRDSKKTLLGDVMTAPVETEAPNTSVEDALARMIRGHFRHLPIVDKDQRPVGIVSIRYLLMRRIGETQASLDIMAALAGAGGPG
jgi:CBS domain-containing protein